jgi:hypothetical protein
MVKKWKNSKKDNFNGLNLPGFLYLSEAVLAKVKEAAGDGGKGTIDELRLSPLYDTMSDLIFPWCSTLTSRARYFYFTYAVLKLALNATVQENSVNPDYGRDEVSRLAEKKLAAFKMNVRRIEKFLALALFLKGNQTGVAGRNKLTRWLQEDRGKVNARHHDTILSLDGRYPNAIYRAPCKRLSMFSNQSHNLGLISARLLAEDTFDPSWANAGRFAVKELEQVVDFWQQNSDRTLAEAAKLFRDSVACSCFRGFKLLPGEANFLYDKIGERTAYWQPITPSQLVNMMNAPVDFHVIKKHVPSNEGIFFDAAHHIDIATRSFRHYYAEIVEDPDHPPSLAGIKEALPDIRISATWLDTQASLKGMSSQQWALQWATGYSALIHQWTASVEQGPSALAKELKYRAESVVANRGGGKEAPHQRRSSHADDIDKELSLQPSSFRLANALRILKDISDEITHG